MSYLCDFDIRAGVGSCFASCADQIEQVRGHCWSSCAGSVFSSCSDYSLCETCGGSGGGGYSSSSLLEENAFDWGLAGQGFKDSFPLFLSVFAVFAIVRILHLPFK